MIKPNKTVCHCPPAGGNNAIYGLGVVGALFYFLSTAVGIWAVIIGIVKSIFWPAVLVYWLLNYLQM